MLLCDLCKVPIDRYFVDGVVRGQGWATMCQSCHEKHGVGLGIGRGQLYQWQEKTKEFKKIEG